MKSYSETDVFKPRAIRLLRSAETLVTVIPDPVFGEPPLRCHEVARVVGAILGLDVQDGRYGAVDHSWLWLDRYPPTPRTCLLDVYAVGRLPQVQLVDLNFVLPHWKDVDAAWRHAGYAAGNQRTDVRADVIKRLSHAVRSNNTNAMCDKRRMW